MSRNIYEEAKTTKPISTEGYEFYQTPKLTKKQKQAQAVEKRKATISAKKQKKAEKQAQAVEKRKATISAKAEESQKRKTKLEEKRKQQADDLYYTQKEKYGKSIADELLRERKQFIETGEITGRKPNLFKNLDFETLADIENEQSSFLKKNAKSSEEAHVSSEESSIEEVPEKEYIPPPKPRPEPIPPRSRNLDEQIRFTIEELDRKFPIGFVGLRSLFDYYTEVSSSGAKYPDNYLELLSNYVAIREEQFAEILEELDTKYPLTHGAMLRLIKYLDHLIKDPSTFSSYIEFISEYAQLRVAEFEKLPQPKVHIPKSKAYKVPSEYEEDHKPIRKPKKSRTPNRSLQQSNAPIQLMGWLQFVCEFRKRYPKGTPQSEVLKAASEKYNKLNKKQKTSLKKHDCNRSKPISKRVKQYF